MVWNNFVLYGVGTKMHFVPTKYFHVNSARLVYNAEASQLYFPVLVLVDFYGFSATIIH